MQELISARQAAERLSISHSQVTRLCANGTLRYQRLDASSALLIDADSVRDADARRKAGRPRKWRYDGLLQELRMRGHDAIARKIERIFGVR